MKEVLIRIVIAAVFFLVGYLLMSFVVASFDVIKWTIDQRGTLAIIEGLVIIMISTCSVKITK